MNAPEGNNGSIGVAAVTLDPENPWLGLFSYTEQTRAYFHGRDDETGELARRVQRKPLSVLFGQSGLGKTSLLRAGLVPRLRAEGFCPVYVRVDYAPESPSPSEQIKQAILKASSEAGCWTRSGVAVEGESLWEFMHHRGDLLRDAGGRTLMPLLIFDQFEEVFTLGQADDAGRLRARQYLEDLADLVENRPPAALEARIEEDDAAAEDFDFARADYRVLIALREDYLAHLESVKGFMPSITQNRMRLARMNGAQALSAVVKPGGRLVSQEVAESIVRFVAGGSELGNAEIEPSLLSLICRELNTVRLGQGRAEISADLLAGSRDTILSEFYERALADQPAGVRRVVEDELLTDSGHRESLAEERVAKALVAAGASPDALATLVDRRLLRIEDRLDMRRVELTHDVLCNVVLASRELRHEREARDEAQRQLAVQEQRESETRRALVRARMIASVCGVLMVVAAISAVFGWVNLRRARVADAQAQQARADAEKLVGFLIEDFYTELQPTGRLETLGKLAHMTVSYYDGLPKNLVTPRTESMRAMAMLREGSAIYLSGDTDKAYKQFAEAQSVFERLRKGGDSGEDTTFGLALALNAQGRGVIDGTRGKPEQLVQAADLLRPLATSAKGSPQVKLAYAENLNYLSHTQPKPEGVNTAAEGRKVLAGIGALDLSNLAATAAYADLADSEARHLMALNRLDEAKVLEREVYSLAEQVLVKRPGDLRSLSNRYLSTDLLGRIAMQQYDLDAAMDFAERSREAAEDLVRANPSDLQGWSSWIQSYEQLASRQFDQGLVTDGLQTMRAGMRLEDDPRKPWSLRSSLYPRRVTLMNVEGMVGQPAAAQHSLLELLKDVEATKKEFDPSDLRLRLFKNVGQRAQARLDLYAGRYQAAYAGATADLHKIDAIKIPRNEQNAQRFVDGTLRFSLYTAIRAALAIGKPAEAEALSRRLLSVSGDRYSEVDPQAGRMRTQVFISRSLIAQGRDEEARAGVEAALPFLREQQKAGARGMTFRRDLVYALAASAQLQSNDAAGNTRARAELDEASQLLEAMPAEIKVSWDYQDIARAVAKARIALQG